MEVLQVILLTGTNLPEAYGSGSVEDQVSFRSIECSIVLPYVLGFFFLTLR